MQKYRTLLARCGTEFGYSNVSAEEKQNNAEHAIYGASKIYCRSPTSTLRLGFCGQFIGIVGWRQWATIVCGSHYLAIRTSGMKGEQVAALECRERNVGGKYIAALADRTYHVVVNLRIRTWRAIIQ